MLAKRIIACLDVRNGVVVKGEIAGKGTVGREKQVQRATFLTVRQSLRASGDFFRRQFDSGNKFVDDGQTRPRDHPFPGNTPVPRAQE